MAVEAPHRHQRRGSVFHVRIDIKVPGRELVVKSRPCIRAGTKQPDRLETARRNEAGSRHTDIYVALRDTFGAARRKLQGFARKRAGVIKHHDEPPRARIVRLFAEDGYGFLETADGREVYFQRNSVLNGAFDRLKEGSEVTFAEEMGEKGLRASTVRLIRRQRAA